MLYNSACKGILCKKEKLMKFILTAGGTGGHIYPALSVLEEIKKDKNNEYLYIGTKNRMENDLIPSMGIPYEGLEIYGLSKNVFKNIKNIKCIMNSYKKCLKIIDEFKPDAVIAFGGYVTLPVCLAAKKRKVKIFIHEQNMLPGKSNIYLSKKADAVFISFKDGKRKLKNKDIIYTGNPVSQRAEILFITGKGSYTELNNNLVVPKSTKIVPFFDNLPSLMKSADLIISRAGASTIAEIMATKTPSILIPSPYVANNHQYYNALDLVNQKISILLEEKDLNKNSLVDAIDEIFSENTSKEIKKNLNEITVLDSSTIILDEVKKIIKGKNEKKKVKKEI